MARLLWAVAELFITRHSVQKKSMKKKCVQSDGCLRYMAGRKVMSSRSSMDLLSE